MRLGRIVWAAVLAGGGAAIGHAALRTEDGRELDENLCKAANAQRSGSADRMFGAITEAGSLYAVGAAAIALAVLGRRMEGGRALAGAATTRLALPRLKRAVEPPPALAADPRGAP